MIYIDSVDVLFYVPPFIKAVKSKKKNRQAQQTIYFSMCIKH